MITINGEPYQLDTKVENEILFLRDLKDQQAEQIERLTREAEGVSEDAWDSLKRKIQQLEEQLIQANLDIIRLEKNNAERTGQ